MPARTFSERHGFSAADAPIIVRHDAPPDLRDGILMLAQNCGLGGKALRAVVCQALLIAPDSDNWSSGPVWEETLSLTHECPWPKVYEIAEAIYLALLHHHGDDQTAAFQARLNSFFRERGIGWQMTDGQIEFRGPTELEESLTIATSAIEQGGLSEAPRFLKEGRQCLSRRPEPNSADAVVNAMKALEAVTRHVAGDETATLGTLIRTHRHLFPAPLDKAVEGAWGFASQEARHGREGQRVEVREAELILGLAAAVSAYLLRPPSDT